MSETSTVFVFIATYGSVDDARQDYEAVKELHRQGVIGTYDAAVVEKGPDGKVHEVPASVVWLLRQGYYLAKTPANANNSGVTF